jgi:hypothetical protein
MSKSKFGNSNLYMTTKEFADLVITALEEQNYFKKNDVAHPLDLAYAFSTVGETIGTAMSWAIKQEHAVVKKEAVMKAGNLIKSDGIDDYSETKHYKHVLGEDFVSSASYSSENEINRKRGYL